MTTGLASDSKYKTLGYATYSRRSALVMGAIDCLNPFKRHTEFQWETPCVISSVDGIGDLIIQMPLIQGMLKRANQEGRDVRIFLRPNGAPFGRMLGWPVTEFENPLQLFFKCGPHTGLLVKYREQYRQLRGQKPAMWIDLTGNAVNALFIKSVGVGKLVSKISRGGRSMVDMVIPHDVACHEYAYQQSLAEFFGVAYDRSVYRQLVPRIATGDYTILSITTPFRWKSWPLQNYVHIASRFENRHFVVTGLSGELPEHETDAYRQLIALPNVTNLMDRLSLLELARKIASARAIVTADTSTLHLAGAFNIPGGAIFGPSDPDLWMPPEGPRLFRAPHCPFHPCKQWTCEDIPNWCLTKIDLNAVCAHLDSVLNKRGVT